ncbi:MAG: OmpA family protein [Haliea sp.]|nr:MAG: OmpA family protein [Haliea sp.]
MTTRHTWQMPTSLFPRHPGATTMKTHTMNRSIRQIFRPAALCLAALLCSQAVLAQAVLTPQKLRITDEAIQADHDAYRLLQGEIHRLNEGGQRPVRDYTLSKAQCWLDVSFHEYTRNDRSSFVQEAMTESEKLIRAMQGGVAQASTDTPLVNSAARLRPDLWDRATSLKRHAGYQCAQQKVACGEVELVHAGNEFNQAGWRHAKPYVQIAEDLFGEAEALAASCLPAPVAAAPVQAPVLAPQPASLRARVLFDFDRSGVANADLSDLDRALEFAKAQGMTLQTVSLVGHADRLNSTGNAAYNQQLSQKRAATVRDVLVQRGFEASKISVDFKGDSQQVEGCTGLAAGDALRQCLAANRRVEVVFGGMQKAR